MYHITFPSNETRVLSLSPRLLSTPLLYEKTFADETKKKETHIIAALAGKIKKKNPPIIRTNGLYVYINNYYVILHTVYD